MPDGTWYDPSVPLAPMHPLGSEHGGSSGYGTAKMCRNPILEKDQPYGVSDTTQGIPKVWSASLSCTNLGVVCRGSEKVSNFSRATDQWVAEPGARQALDAVPREAVGMVCGGRAHIPAGAGVLPEGPWRRQPAQCALTTAVGDALPSFLGERCPSFLQLMLAPACRAPSGPLFW